METTPPTEDPRPGLPPPKLSLRSLFALTAVVGLCLTAFHYWGAMGLAAALLAFSVIGAHLLGSSLGTQLRDIGTQHREPRRAESAQAPIAYAPQTSLGDRRSISVGKLIASAVGGALCAGGGALMFWAIYGGRITWIALGVGGAAFFVLGSMATFIIVVFVGEAARTISEASKQD